MRSRLAVILTITALALTPGFFKVYAENLTVTCNLNDCTNDGVADFCSMSPSSGAALFNETNQLPGYSVSRRITVNNTGACDCNALLLATTNETLSLGTPADFPTKLFTVIKSGASDVYGIRNGDSEATSNKNLNDIYNAASVSLGSLGAGQSKNYDWVLTFDPLTGNDYQAVETKFDFNMEFQCGHVSSGGGEVDTADDDDDDGGGGGTPSTPAGFFTPFFETFFPEAGTVAGVETTQSTEEAPLPPPGEVGGTSEGRCVDPWWWWLVFVVQLIIHAVVAKVISKDSLNKKKRYYLAQLLTGVLFVVIFYKFFCPWWDYLLAFIFGLVWLALTKHKFDKLEKELTHSMLPPSEQTYKRLS